MTTLALAITGLLAGGAVALLYWLPRAAMRARALAQIENHQGQAQPHIEVLKLRAARLSATLWSSGKVDNQAASRRFDEAIETGDREALLIMLQEHQASHWIP